MLFFTQDNYKKIIDNENKNLDNIVVLLETKKMELIKISSTLISVSDKTSVINSDDFYDNTLNLKSAYETIQKLESFIDSQKKLLLEINEAFNENPNMATIQDMEDYFFEQKDIFSNRLIEFEKTLTPILNSTFDISLSSIDTSDIDDSFSDYSEINEYAEATLKNNKNNKILLVSEKEQKAFLPYKIANVKKLFENPNNNYTSMEDVINNVYVIPLKRFQNSSISRFRESYKLIRNKENGSLLQALDLGLELMFNYDLNPIIIAACSTLEELNIYLDCLEEQELYDFDCFEIRFEIAPISKR